ncbi:uncharacterized protein LOC119100035 [Pollicipes pollicipes]|uniref:uncharacterized protein LOC119100035 n=1 Tax=Pollicipes pollicipes TaxID=41117 RepID=UPI001884F33A|nr:uncharacterized protein LOC119100035 [Pollicipes pollicipes]
MSAAKNIRRDGLQVVDEDRYGSVCPPQRSSMDPVRTPAWGESVTRYDFKSPHGPGVRARRAEKLSYYQRFMDDMCQSSHILDRVAEFGTLGGSITQYQDDFCQRLPSQDLQNRYRSRQPQVVNPSGLYSRR